MLFQLLQWRSDLHVFVVRCREGYGSKPLCQASSSEAAKRGQNLAAGHFSEIGQLVRML